MSRQDGSDRKVSAESVDSSTATILHVDLDAFFASVELLDRPDLVDKPVVVAGKSLRSVVTAANYPARKFGVRSAISLGQAMRLCPKAIVLEPHFEKYRHYSKIVMGIFDDVTPLVQRIGIDEAFLDVSGATHLFGPPARIGAMVRARVRADVGLPISVGAARTKHLAKIASQVAKPDGLVVVQPGSERAFLDPLPVALIWGVGPVNRQRLADRGIRTIGDLARTPSSAVERILGHAVGHKLSAMAHDEDPRRVATAHRAGSVGAQSALSARPPEREGVRAVLAHLADRISRRMRAKDRAGRTVTVRVRFAGMRSVTRSRTLAQPVATTLTLTEVAERLVWSAIGDSPGRPEVTLLGVSVSSLTEQRTIQLELDLAPDDPWRPGSATGSARRAVDGSVDAIRTRFGSDAVGYLPAVMGAASAVPDEFRELAEHDL